MKEYQLIYKKSFVQELADIIVAAKLEFDDEIKNIVNEITCDVMNNAGIHFGHPYYNSATMAGIYRMTLKRVAEEYGVEFPIKKENKDEAVSSWWLQA
ncbi:MAG: hypothetical protein IJW53_02985 [Clostridia bacterium]|nr:hypothetical protein [Clostridia bacterium]